MEKQLLTPAFIKRERLAVAGVVVLFFISQMIWYWDPNGLAAAPAPLLRSLAFYGVYRALSDLLLPRLFSGRQTWRMLASLAGFLLLTATVIEMSGMLLPEAAPGYGRVVYFSGAFLYAWSVFLFFGLYISIRTAILYAFFNTGTAARYRVLVKDGLVAAGIWLTGFILLIVDHSDGEILLAWVLIAPFTPMVYAWTFFKLAPRVKNKKRSFLRFAFGFIVMLLLSYPVFALATMMVSDNVDFAFGLASVVCFLHFLLMMPLFWFLAKRHHRGNEELYLLRKELNQSNASLDLLRSQINPHFLFNALNTIYGMAIQENATRTTAGIEMLSDMMRFMLHENLKEAIPLNRELEYLQHYISLQKLRVDAQPGISLETELPENVPSAQITPMLLIPFVENAFKHGISFREPSKIRISLRVEANTLYFDVYNTRHNRPEADPEKFSNGIGIDNVRQRLELLYPGKHELVIREIPDWFFVHLRLDLQ